MKLDTGRALRNQGMQQTLAFEPETWQKRALHLLECFAAVRSVSFTAEQFRQWTADTDLGDPHSHKVWGALFYSAARAGLIVNTGQYVKASSAKTHAHPVPLWRKA